MNNYQHLLFNALILTIVSFILFKSVNFNILNLNLYHLLFAVYLFSNLPDIDHAKSKITKTFYLVYLILFLFGFAKKNYLWMILAIVLSLLHFSIAKDSKFHRSYPHKIWFGAFCSLTLWYFTSLYIGLIGLFCFVLHLIADKIYKS